MWKYIDSNSIEKLKFKLFLEILLLNIAFGNKFPTAMFSVSGLGRGIPPPFPPVATPLVGISQVGISRFSIDHCIIYFASAGPKFLSNGPKVGDP